MEHCWTDSINSIPRKITWHQRLCASTLIYEMVLGKNSFAQFCTHIFWPTWCRPLYRTVMVVAELQNSTCNCQFICYVLICSHIKSRKHISILTYISEWRVFSLERDSFTTLKDDAWNFSFFLFCICRCPEQFTCISTNPQKP